MIEKQVYSKLCEQQQQDFVEEHCTRKKLDFAAKYIGDISETYYLLGLIYNNNLHWKEGRDFVSPLVARLEHPTIKYIISCIQEQ